MANVVAFEDVKHTRTHRIVDGGKSAWRTNYMNATDEEPEQPVAFLAESGPMRNLRAHYHQNDQFQIFVTGGGHAGKHPIKPFQVHFSRAYTPYGPIVAKEDGVAFLTLRARKDPGAQYLPEKRDLLLNVKGRDPWQLTCAVEFPEAKGPISLKPLEGMADDRGLAGQAITMPANAVARGPDCSKSNGQYIVVLGGSLMHEGREHKATTIIFVEPKDGTFELHAGPGGLNAVALNFPRATVHGEKSDAPAKQDDAGLKVWQCVLCAFVYDEAAGMPDEGIPPGTRWKDVPEDWGCPDCSAKKNDFEMVEI